MCVFGQEELPRFILFGDSLTEWSFDESTEGFGWRLANEYQNVVEVENEGYAGYTSQRIKPEFQTIISRITRPGGAPTLLFAIFLGANDACLVGNSEYIPLANFDTNIREFVEAILDHAQLPDTKIVLITPPPINVPDPVLDDGNDESLPPAARAAIKASHADIKSGRGYRTYLSKKRYADRIMQIARDYEETGRVLGLDYWKALVDAALQEQGRLGDPGAYDEERLPGCGLPSAKPFRNGYFTDGLHLDSLGYNVLSKALRDAMLNKWPELAPVHAPTFA